MFVQIDTLTSYHAALLNRDDAGLAKRIPFGNSERMRVSSQCLKRHWRLALQDELDLPRAFRSRHFFERVVVKRLCEEHNLEETQARDLVASLVAVVMQSKDKTEKENPLFLKQPVLFGKPEADYFVNLVQECATSGEDPGEVLKDRAKEHKKNFRAMLRAAGGDDLMAGVEGAMFGRFITSDILARTDAAVHVAHAFTVHPLDNEVDYFTVVDDLKEAGEDAGAAHAGDMELGAGLFYGYVVIDVPLLVSNLSGCEHNQWKEDKQGLKDAANVIRALTRSIATVSPGAKLGSTAPYARAECVLLETGNNQPRSLANAYLKALSTRGDVMQEALDRMGDHLTALDGMYGCQEKRFVASTRKTDSIPEATKANLHESSESAVQAAIGA